MSRLNRCHAFVLRTLWRVGVAYKALVLTVLLAFVVLVTRETVSAWIAVPVGGVAMVIAGHWAVVLGNEWRYGPRRDPDPRARPASAYCGGEYR